MTLALIDLLRASVERSPEAEAVVHNGCRVRYGELWRRVCALAGFLNERGFRKNDRVALLLENSPEYVAAYCGVLAAGGAVVAFNTQAKARDLTNWLRHSGARWLIADVRHPELAALLPERGTCEVIGVARDGVLPPENIHDWNALLNTADIAGVHIAASAPNDLAQIIYTSGTTGAPKGVMLSHANLYNNVRSILAYLQLTENDRILNVLPFYYSYGNSVLHTHLAVGGALILENSLAYPHRVIQRIVDEQVTGFSGVPSTYALLLSRVSLQDYDLSRLRYLTQAGGGMPPAHIMRVRAELPHARLFVMYGQTEATARIAYLPPEKLEEKMGSVGIAIPGVEMELHEEHGEAVANGAVGEIWVRGPNVMLGYWNDPETTARVMQDHWLKTGDLARQDADGYFFIQGRSSDMIKTGAHRVSPQEIEQTILELDGVAEAAVVGVPDEILGEVIKAVLVPREGFTLERLAVQAHCHRRLAPYKVPKLVEFVNELPKTASGKIKRYLLTGVQ